MSVLTEQDYLGLLECVRQLGEVQDASSAHFQILEAIITVVPCEHAAYNELPTRLSGRPLSIFNTADIGRASVPYMPAFMEHMGEHPIARRVPRNRSAFQRAPDFVRKISDYLPDSRLRRLGLFQDCYRHLDTEYQLVANLPTRGSMIVGVALNRKGKDFNERDRKVMKLLTPHLAQVYDRLARRSVARQLVAGSTDATAEEELHDRLCRQTPTLDAQHLTDREADVLLWIVRGKTNPEIGIILGISPRTAQKHIEHLFAKFGVESRSACVAHVLDAWR